MCAFLINFFPPIDYSEFPSYAKGVFFCAILTGRHPGYSRLHRPTDISVETGAVEKRSISARKHGKNKRTYNKLLLASDRWDIVRSWEKIREKLKQVNHFLIDEEFSIYLEDTLQLTRTLKPQSHAKDVAHVQCSGVDVILCTGFSTTVTRWNLKGNGRECKTDLLKFPYIISSFLYIVEIRVFVCLTLENLLVILVSSQGSVKEAKQVQHLYNAHCLAYIKETKQIIVAGIGLLKYYNLSGIEVCVAIEKSGNIKTTMSKNEVLVDPSWRRLLVVGESGVYVINYTTMKQEFVLTGSQDAFAHISCCSVYQNKYIVTGSEVGIIRIWASSSFSKVTELEGHRRSITAVCCHPREPLLFSSSTDGIIFIWRMDNFSKFKQLHAGDTVRRLGIMWDTGIVAIWCLVTDRIFIYEFCDFYTQFNTLESEVIYLQRLRGHGEHPNRIMVATMDGGMKFLNPVTGFTLGFMYPIISLETINVFVYSAFRRNIYMLLKAGSILEVGCTNSPFRAVEVREPINVDEIVYCLISVFLVIQTGGAEIKDEVIFLGLCNGQISVLESECFALPSPVQAHLGGVCCLEAVAEISLEEEVQYTTCQFILSGGSDNTIKLWRLKCHFSERGPELAFHIMAKIRCETTPKRLSGTSDRIFVVYDDERTMAMFDVCHLFNDSAIDQKVSLLKHTSDYDHTDQITALDKCPLVGIFATASRDGTVKIWGNNFQLIRELVFFLPLLSLCFVNDRGDLLVGKENVIILCSVEKYLPWHRLEHMITRNFEDERKEKPLKFKEGISSWINPAIMPKSTIPHCLRSRMQNRTAKVPVTSERWSVSWDTPRGKRALLKMPVTLYRSQRPVSDTLHEKWRNMSVVLPTAFMASEDAVPDIKVVQTVNESLSYTVFRRRLLSLPKVVVTTHPVERSEGIKCVKRQSMPRAHPPSEPSKLSDESKLWLRLELNPSKKGTPAKTLAHIMIDLRRKIREEKKSRKARKSLEAKIEIARAAEKNYWAKKPRRVTENSLAMPQQMDTNALGQQSRKIHERRDTDLDTIQEGHEVNPLAAMLSSDNLLPTHYNILREDKNPMQLLKDFMEGGRQNHSDESSESSSSSDEAEDVKAAEDENGLFHASSLLQTKKKPVRRGTSSRGLQTVREFLTQSGVVISSKSTDSHHKQLLSTQPIYSSRLTSGSLELTSLEQDHPSKGDNKYKIQQWPAVDKASLTSYKRKMKAVELPNSLFKKEVHLPPSAPPTLHDLMQEKVIAAVDALEGPKPQRPRVSLREIQERVIKKLMLIKKKKKDAVTKTIKKEEKSKKGKKEVKELNITEWRKENLPVFSTKLVLPLEEPSPSQEKSFLTPKEAMCASRESLSAPNKNLLISKLSFFTLSKLLPVLKISVPRGEETETLILELPADEIAPISSTETAPTSRRRSASSLDPSVPNHQDEESDVMMRRLPADPFSVSNNASSPDEEREICSIHLSLEPAEMRTPRPYTAYTLLGRLTKDHQSRSNNTCTQNDTTEKKVDQRPFRAKMSRTILEAFGQQTHLLEQVRRENWCPRQVDSSNPVTTFSALLGLLVHGTSPDVISQVCGYLLNLKRHFFIPKSFLRKSAALLLRVLKSTDDVKVQRVCLYSLPHLTRLRHSVVLVIFPTLVNSNVTDEFIHGQTEETDRKSSDNEFIGLQHQAPLLVTRHSETSPSGPPGPGDTSAASTLLHYRQQDAPSSPPSHHSQACSTDCTQGRVLSDGGGLDGRRAAVNTLVFTKNVNIPTLHSFSVSTSSFQIRRNYLHITRNSSYLMIKSHHIPRKLPFVSGESSHVTSGCSQVAAASSRIIRKSAHLVEARLYPSTCDHDHRKQRRGCQIPLKIFVSQKVFSTEVPDPGESSDLTDKCVIYVWDSLPQSSAAPAASDVPNTASAIDGAGNRLCDVRKRTGVKSKPAHHVRGDNSPATSQTTQLQPLRKGSLTFDPTIKQSCLGRQNDGWATMPTRRPLQRLTTSPNGPGRPVAMTRPHTLGLSPSGVSQRRVLLQRKMESRLLGVRRNMRNHTDFTKLSKPQEMSLTRLSKSQDMSLTRLLKPLDAVHGLDQANQAASHGLEKSS